MLNIEKINSRFKNAAELILRFRWWNIGISLLLLVVSVVGLTKVQSDVDAENWFLEDDALLAARDRFEKIFGNDDFCAVLIEVDDVFTPEVLSKIKELGQELREKVPYADDVISLIPSAQRRALRLLIWYPIRYRHHPKP